ncbi:MFS transporter [Propioniciclava coleopterorum]|uniref:MFS transporter n=1 Tax=Propioniciclava coleopterorum TaxID=2714937 RepID=A0A6G7Y3R3_9ACTN|nr:MFS transporter [Propioniciclava coleopterorum]QIK71316.1 MFS transporter [Propioniciclava coleopterorum]
MTPSRRGLTLGLLVCVTAVAFEGMAVVTAMPAAAADLGDQELYAWAFSAVMIPQLFAIAAAGRVADRTGPVRPLLVGLGLFAVGVVVAALAPTMLILLVGRFIQGLGGGAVNLCLMVVTARAFDPAERARIMTWYSACWMMPSFVGPGIAAWVTEHLSWHWVFWLILPFVGLGLAFMASGLRQLPPRTDADAPGDPVPLHAAAAVAIGLALLQAAGQRLEWLSLVWLVVGLALLVLNWRRLMPRGYSPAAPGLSAVVMVRLLTSGTFFGVQSFLPLMLTTRGTPLLRAGLVITLASVGWMLGSWLQARPWLRLSRDQIIVAGAVSVASGAALVAVAAWVPASDLLLTTVGFATCGLGMGLQSASTNLATMQLSSEAELGRNTGSLQVGETAGNALFVGIAGTVFAALNPIAATQVTFGTQMTLLAAVALLAIAASKRIGFVENHSLTV